MAIYILNPLRDARWAKFVDRHARASVFHTPGWLDALERTYGYQPVVYTTTPPEAPLENGIVLCRVASWLTGQRLVSLPFTDHCEVLVDEPGTRDELLRALADLGTREKLKYIELRSPTLGQQESATWRTGSAYRFHLLDLRPTPEQLFRATHKTSIQQRIRRAEREHVVYDEGRSDELLEQFYRLLLMTRRRHQLPPQPMQWFQNLRTCLGEHLTVRVARKDGQSVASVLTLQWRDTIFYKYGCSDANFHNLGGISLLLWRTIQEAKASGATSLDFGRSDSDNEGLVAFKDRWGSTQSSLSYVRHSAASVRQATNDGYATRALQHVFARMPDQMLTAAGRLLYKHIG